MRIYKVKVLDIVIYALYLAIFKQYFIPDSIRQILKLIIVVGVLWFLVSKLPRKKLINISILFSLCVIISGLINYLSSDSTLKALADSILYGLCFYNIYTLALYCNFKNYTQQFLKCLYKITFLYCFLTVISVLIVGTENNSNVAAYLFGNKFISSYYFILLLALYRATYDIKYRKNKMIFYGIIVFSILFSLYVHCATVTVSGAFLLIICLLPKHIKDVLSNPKIVVTSLLASAAVLISFESLLQVDLINNLVVNIFDKSYTIAGRLVVYNNYLEELIRNKLILGYGYSNGKLFILSSGVFSNAQNGLFEHLINYGLVGVASLIYTVYYCFKKSDKGEITFSLSLVVYGMIAAAIVEVSLNWFFLLGISLVRWCVYSKQSN